MPPSPRCWDYRHLPPRLATGYPLHFHFLNQEHPKGVPRLPSVLTSLLNHLYTLLIFFKAVSRWLVGSLCISAVSHLYVGRFFWSSWFYSFTLHGWGQNLGL